MHTSSRVRTCDLSIRAKAAQTLNRATALMRPAEYNMLSFLAQITFLKPPAYVRLLRANETKQGRQCKYNVTMRRVRESLLPWKSSITYFWVCVRAGGCTGAGVCFHACSLSSPACNAPPQSFAIFLSAPNFWALSKKRHDIPKIVTEHKTSILVFATTCVQNISHSRKNSSRYSHKCENGFLSDLNET